MAFDPNEIATLYYFGDLGYWKLPRVAADALEMGFDGPSLRKLAGVVNPVLTDLPADEIDSAFREMGVNAPIPKDVARLHLATESAKKAISGESNVFDQATHIKIHLCSWTEVPPELRRIVGLSEEAESSPRTKWAELERELAAAMAQFLRSRS